MNFTFTEEQLALEDTIERFVANEYPFEKRNQRKNEKGFSRELWNTYAELGLLALPFAEEYDGLGGNAIDTFVAMRALAKGLPTEPYIHSVVLCGELLTQLASEEQKQTFIPQIAMGETVFALAHYEPKARFNDAYVQSVAKKEAEQWVITGHKAMVHAAEGADQLLVSAKTAEDQVSLFAVPVNAEGVKIHGYELQDGSRAAEVILKEVRLDSSALIGQAGQALASIQNAIAVANVALVAETTGLLRALLAATQEYMQTRKQFGVALATFQTVQHRLADMAIAAEEVEAMALRAAIDFQKNDLQLRLKRASGAKAFVAEKSRLVGQEAIQLHGGIGVTDELNVAHFFKRVTTINMTYGDEDYHLQRYSDLLDYNGSN